MVYLNLLFNSSSLFDVWNIVKFAFNSDTYEVIGSETSSETGIHLRLNTFDETTYKPITNGFLSVNINNESYLRQAIWFVLNNTIRLFLLLHFAFCF